MRVGIINNINNMYSQKNQAACKKNYMTNTGSNKISDTVSFGTAGLTKVAELSPVTKKMFDDVINLLTEKQKMLAEELEKTVTEFIQKNPEIEVRCVFAAARLKGTTEDGWKVLFKVGSDDGRYQMDAIKGEESDDYILKTLDYEQADNKIIKLKEFNRKDKYCTSIWIAKGKGIDDLDKEVQKYLKAVLPKKAENDLV